MSSKARPITSKICLAIAAMLVGNSISIITYEILTERAPDRGASTLVFVAARERTLRLRLARLRWPPYSLRLRQAAQAR